MFDDPKITKVIIFALIGIIVVLTIAVIYLAVKKNTYYVDEEGNEITHFRKAGNDSDVPPVRQAAPVSMPVEEQPEPDFDEIEDAVDGSTLDVPTASVPEEVSSVDIAVTIDNSDTNEHRISGFPCLMGRDAGCDLVIREPAVSRRHAQLMCENGGLYLEDVSEHNGTYLNGVKLPSLGKAKVHEGDVINLGRAEIVIGRIRY